MHEQPHGAIEIAFVEERRCRLGMALRRGKLTDLLPPKRRRRRVDEPAPTFQGRDHLTGRIENLTARKMRHARDGRRRMPVPPGREPFEGGCRPHRVGLGTVEPGHTPRDGVALENRLRHRHEVVDPGIGKALATRFMKGKLPAQAEDVPRIDRRPAADRAKEEVGGRIEPCESLVGPGSRAHERPPCRDDVARDSSEHPRRRSGHAAGETFGSLGPPKLREHCGQRHVLHLPCPPRSQERVDVPAHAAERLAQPLHLGVEPLPMIGRQRTEQPAVEVVAVARDARQQLGERQPGMMGARAPAGKPRRHEHHARKHR